jgi:flagellar basal-body rod protein FlgC
MNVSFAAPLSGIQTVLTRQDVSANNIANIDTPGFSQSDVSQTDMSPAGVRVTSLKRTANLSTENSNTDLAKEAVEQIQNKNELAANVNVIKVQDKMLGALLDIIA